VSVPWQGLLLSVSLLTFWNLPTTAQLTIESVPANAVEGSDVLLLAHNLPENLQGYYWYKGESAMDNQQIALYVIATQETRPGSVYSGREKIYPNGSLLFQNVTQNDTGFYTLQTLNISLHKELASVQLHVYAELPKPFITSNNSSPLEGEDSVALMCEPETQDTTYLWWINGHSLLESDRLKLSESNRTLTLLNVTRNDTGPFECGTWNPVSANRSDPVTLNVLYGPDSPIISPSDSYFGAGTNLNLSCQAASNPTAQYSWLFNEWPQSSTQELFIPNITTNNSGSYTCLVHNSATGVNRTTVKNITVLELVTKPSINTTTNTTVTEQGSVVLICVSYDTGISIRWIFNNQSLRLTERMTLSEGNSTLSIDPVRREDDGEYQCEVYNMVSSRRSDSIRLAVIYDPTTASSGLSAGAIAGIVVGVVAGVALIVALAHFLFFRKTSGASNQRDLTEHKPSASNHSLGTSDNSPNKVDEVSYSSLIFNTREPKQPIPALSVSTAAETVYLEVKRK
jgi:CD209 antigen